MLFPPETHADNPPETWQVTRLGTPKRPLWALQTASGETLATYKRQREAEADKQSGFLVNLYEKERRWYAGEPVLNWKPYVPKEKES